MKIAEEIMKSLKGSARRVLIAGILLVIGAMFALLYAASATVSVTDDVADEARIINSTSFTVSVSALHGFSLTQSGTAAGETDAWIKGRVNAYLHRESNGTSSDALVLPAGLCTLKVQAYKDSGTGAVTGTASVVQLEE
jgi:hypothetical protein